MTYAEIMEHLLNAFEVIEKRNDFLIMKRKDTVESEMEILMTGYFDIDLKYIRWTYKPERTGSVFGDSHFTYVYQSGKQWSFYSGISGYLCVSNKTHEEQRILKYIVSKLGCADGIKIY